MYETKPIDVKAIKAAFNNFVMNARNNLIFTLVIVAVVLVLIGGSVYVVYFKEGSGRAWIKNVAAPAAAQKVVDYINTYILNDNTGSSLKEVSEVSGMYKLTINFKQQNQDYDVYVTKDGKYLFPVMQGIPIDLDENPNATNATNPSATTCEEVKKSDTPVLEAFVVSQCPYGLQMQRVLSKVVESVNLKNNIKVRYIGSISDGKITSMHGDEEAQENLRQICIREEQGSKYWDYVSCYMKAGETDGCLAESGVNKTSLNACMADPSKGLSYAQEDFDLANQNNVQGSPTLIIDNNQVDEFSFGGRTANALKELICCAFNTKPPLCGEELSTDSAAAGFSTPYSSGTNANQGGGCE